MSQTVDIFFLIAYTIFEILKGGSETLNISDILSWVIFGISFLLGLVSTLIPYLKTAKAKKNAEKVVKALSGFELICKNIQPLVVKAEQFRNFSGAERKEWVMTQLRIVALENSIVFDENAVSEKVEEVVSTTNKVNVNKNVSRETIVAKNEIQTVQG